MTRMRVAFSASVPKDASFRDANEDAFAFSADGLRLALCDGASESFDSRTWASGLAQEFAANPALDLRWVQAAVEQYRAGIDLGAMSWSKQAAYERGSFSTLLGIELNPTHASLEIIAIGDSLAVLLDSGTLAACWPYTSPEQFDERPALLSTNSEMNVFVGDIGFSGQHRNSWNLLEYKVPVLLCMTDALGQWVLSMHRNHEDPWAPLLQMQSERDLNDLVLEQREQRRMRTDDSTLIVVCFDNERPDHAIPDC